MSKTEEKELSLKIYQYLCNIIGTEEVVKTRRNIFCAVDSFFQVKKHAVISTGSKAEGLDIKGSDYDQMFVDNDFQVHENKSKVSSFAKKNIIMDTSDTKPGFTKLKLNNPRLIYVWGINHLVEIVEGEAYISSKLFREVDLSHDMVIHGPCKSDSKGLYDFADCLRCKEWIAPAHQWFSRSRSSWPDTKLVMSVIKLGVLFVPIGCKGSLNADFEWRISFSMAEKQLIFSFSHTQLLCYRLLKIILKGIIQKKHYDLICSYFLKTIMFWLCEESDPKEWHPRNMICCFMNCLRRLIYCVEYKTCRHYFIPENNLFECRFTDHQHKCLLELLNDINNSLWTYVFHTDTFQRFRDEHGISSLPYLTSSSLSCLTYPKMLANSLYFLNSKNIITRLSDTNNTELLTYMMSLISKSWMQSPDGNNYSERNKLVYKQYKISLNCFKAGLYPDSNSAWSLLASLFYKHKRFNECIDIVNYTLSKCTPDKIMLSYENSLSEQTYFQIFKTLAGFLSTCKNLIIECVTFIKPYDLLPVESNPLIRHDHFYCIIPPVVYLNIVSVLCLHHLRDHRGKQNAIRVLELTIQEGFYVYQISWHHKIANTCLQIAKSMK